MRHIVSGFSLFLAALVSVANAAPAKIDVRDAFFTNSTVWRLRIDLDEKAVASLRQDSHRYVTATVTEGDRVFRNVGLHLKGNQGSFQPLEQKPSLTLNFDKFVRDQKFHGLDKLYLNNSAQDPSYMTEYIGSELFRAAGIPAARVSYHNPDDGRFVFIPSGMDQMFMYPQGPLLADCSGLIAAAVLYSPEGRQRYRERCATLVTNLFAINRLTNMLHTLHQRLRPVLAEISAEPARQHDVSIDQLRKRISVRIEHVRQELTPPAEVSFDFDGVAIIREWRPHITIGHAELTITSNETPALVIKCAGGHCWLSMTALTECILRHTMETET